MSPAAAGVRTQWNTRHRTFPPLLCVLGHAPHWLFAVCRARALARSDRARDLYERFEAELTAATGHDPVDWPPAWGVVVTRHAARPSAEEPELGRLDPSQALLVGRGAHVGHLPTARLIKTLLEAAFSVHSPNRSMGDDTRARILGACLPADVAPRWRAGLGLEPPAVLVPAAVHEATALVQCLPADAPIDLAGFSALPPEEVIDLVCTAAAVRASLCAAEEDVQEGRALAA